MLPLALSGRPGLFRLFSARKADPAFRAFQKKVLQRDNYTCRYCGFQARDYQEVVNVDQNYHNNKFPNMVTACCFCTQCFFIDSVGSAGYGGGSLIYLPEITQNELNSLCHVLFCAIGNDTGYKSTAQSIYRNFKLRTQVIEEKFGEGCADPSTMGQLLIESPSINEEQKKTILKDLRLLPSRARFRKQVEYWASTALEELSTDHG